MLAGVGLKHKNKNPHNINPHNTNPHLGNNSQKPNQTNNTPQQPQDQIILPPTPAGQ